MSLSIATPVRTILLWFSASAMAAGAPSKIDAAELAVRSSQSRVAQSQARGTVALPLDDDQLANSWGLKVDELQRYRQLMEGPLGVYSPNLDPLTALGIESRSDEERRRYAELQVRMEGRRVEKLLAYQRAYQEAWKRLHPDLHPIGVGLAANAGRSSALPRTTISGRTAVFVKDECAPCDQRVRQLQADGQSFDIYMVGSRHDDARLRRWATRIRLDPEKVRAGTITLNHDAGRWLSLAGRGDLPAVIQGTDR